MNRGGATAREILDRGAEKIERDLKGQPLLEASLEPYFVAARDGQDPLREIRGNLLDFL